MSDLESVFQGQEVAPTVDAPAVSEKKEKISKMKEALKATIATEQDYPQRLHRLSDSIKVVNTLGFGKSGNIILDKGASTSTKRALKPTSVICGYRIQNIGTEAIAYDTEEFTQDETGKYVGTKVQKTLQPGETCDLNRTYMTMFCSIPEISFTLANGKIVASSKKKAKDFFEELASYYFSFAKGEDGSTIAVNDDEVKIKIDDENGKVKPEFEATFGYLNNPKETKGGSSKSGKYSVQDLTANYIQQMLKNQGI